jgi:glycosyltransferase involved in cell wall biosynthesis
VKRILFYSSVADKSLFDIQQFYKIDISILNGLGYEVMPTNKIIDFFYFWKYDLAFLYFYRFSLFAAILSRFFNKKVFFTGGIDDLEKNYCSQKRYLIQVVFFKLCYFFASKCFIVSNADMMNIQKIFRKNIIKSKLILSFHSIESNYFDYHIPSQKDENFVTICWMGSVENVIRKGVDRSIAIFSQLSTFPQFSNSKLYIIGTMGKGTDFLNSVIKKYKLEGKVLFLGNINNDKKINVLSENRYYFQLSKYEGFGIAALEALALENIVLHSGKGGLSDSVSKYGVQIDISQDDTSITKKIIEEVSTFRYNNFTLSKEYVKNNFSMSTRSSLLKSNLEK